MPINERASAAPWYLKPETWFYVGLAALALYAVTRTAGGMRYFRL